MESKHSGQYMTVPSSPKQRFYSQSTNSTPYSFTFPLPEQQFQAQLLQRLQNMNGYQNIPYSILTPNVYQPMSTGLYSFSNTFPQVKQPFNKGTATNTTTSTTTAATTTATTPTATDLILDSNVVNDGEKNTTSSAEEPQTPMMLDPPPMDKKPIYSKQKSREKSSTGDNGNRRKSRVESPPSVIIPTTDKSTTGRFGGTSSPPPLKSPIQSQKSYQNAFTSALSSFITLRGSDSAKKPKNERPNITRSTSEKVSSRSELMDLVQRTTWARQTK